MADFAKKAEASLAEAGSGGLTELGKRKRSCPQNYDRNNVDLYFVCILR